MNLKDKISGAAESAKVNALKGALGIFGIDINNPGEAMRMLEPIINDVQQAAVITWMENASGLLKEGEDHIAFHTVLKNGTLVTYLIAVALDANGRPVFTRPLSAAIPYGAFCLGLFTSIPLINTVNLPTKEATNE